MSQSNLDLLYQDVLLEHHQEPRNFGKLKNTDSQKEGFNPLCGDRVLIEVKYDPKHTCISEIGFTGEGCSICMASSSILMEEVEGKEIEEVKNKIQQFRDLMQGKIPDTFFQSDIKALTGVKRFPVRIKCALLPWVTLKDILENQTQGVTSNE